jgi:hypothetical protein
VTSQRSVLCLCVLDSIKRRACAPPRVSGAGDETRSFSWLKCAPAKRETDRRPTQRIFVSRASAAEVRDVMPFFVPACNYLMMSGANCFTAPLFAGNLAPQKWQWTDKLFYTDSPQIAASLAANRVWKLGLCPAHYRVALLSYSMKQ